MIRIDAGCRCESRTIHVHLHCVYENIIAFRRVTLPQDRLHLVSLTVLELKYRYHRLCPSMNALCMLWSKYKNAASKKKSNPTWESSCRPYAGTQNISLVS